MIGPGRNSNWSVCWLKIDDAGDVGRQQVGRELDALERAADRARERFGKHRLADAGNVLDQHVAAAQKRDQQEVHGGSLADDDLLDVVGHPVGDLVNIVQTILLVQGRRVHACAQLYQRRHNTLLDTASTSHDHSFER